METVRAIASAKICTYRNAANRSVFADSAVHGRSPHLPARSRRGATSLSWSRTVQGRKLILISRKQSYGNTAASSNRVGLEVSATAVQPTHVPEELVLIRAYVRWEEAGKPENMPEEWRQEQYVLAKKDLEEEILDGMTINDIRIRYGLPAQPQKEDSADSSEDLRDVSDLSTIPDEDPSPEPAPPPQPLSTSFTEGGVEIDDRDLRNIYAATASKAGRQGDKGDEELSVSAWIPKWARSTYKGSWSSVQQRIVQLGDLGQLLLEVRTYKAMDEQAESGPRQVVTHHEVVLTTDAEEDLILHWGVARDEPGQWILPKDEICPPGTTAVNDIAVETAFKEYEGCIGKGDNEMCAMMQCVKMEMPGEGPDEILGLQFVVRTATGQHWFKDPDDGYGNFQMSFGERQQRPKDALVGTIVRAETTGSWWTLMHRYNLCASLLNNVLSSADSYADMAKLFVWLRLSSTRQLTWQRNYNVKPRELSHSQSNLTQRFAQVFRDHPHLRDMAIRILSTLGRGGDGGDGQKIRDEILNIMHRNNIKECKGQFLEEWHQKLHNNTTPDDIFICEAYLNFLRTGGDMHAYWDTLHQGGIDRARLEGYERPIITEPEDYPGKRESLINEFENYKKILKAVHSGADLDVCINAVGSRASDKLQQLLKFVRERKSDGNVIALIEACVEARHEIRASGLVPASDDIFWVRELMYLDLAVENIVRLAVERYDTSRFGSMDAMMDLVALVGENLALSTYASSEELVLCLCDWKRLRTGPREGQWALQCKAVVDRMAHVLSSTSDRYNTLMQPVAEWLGKAARCDSWAIDLFTEEVVRSGPGFSLSLLLQRIDPILREIADLSPWQIISPVDATGRVTIVDKLQTIQNEVYSEPTIIVARHVSGGEEIPLGATAVVSGSSVDVLSHAAVRARNSSVLFATCYDGDIVRDLEALEGQPVELRLGAGESVESRVLDSDDALKSQDSMDSTLESKKLAGLAVKVPPPAEHYAIPMSDFTKDVVGAKSKNTLSLHQELGQGQLPDWINLPASVAVPFGVMERVLAQPINEEYREMLAEAVAGIDESSSMTLEESLATCREIVSRLKCPEELQEELGAVMAANDMTIPQGEKWNAAWSALVGVWASKWTERAFISIRNVGIRHEDLRMSVLVQQIIPADYAFVIHTVNPSTEDESQIYAEVVLGLGEVLVGNYPGRALAFTADKANIDQPQIVGFPSKSVAMYIEDCFIFRSDSNGEDLEGYAGAGLYDSIPMYEASEQFVDYSFEPMVWDQNFQRKLLSKIAEIGLAVEQALGAPQDIEGVVKDGRFYVVQTRPQV